MLISTYIILSYGEILLVLLPPPNQQSYVVLGISGKLTEKRTFFGFLFHVYQFPDANIILGTTNSLRVIFFIADGNIDNYSTNKSKAECGFFACQQRCLSVTLQIYLPT